MKTVFYAIDASSNVRGYLRISSGLEKISKACAMSEFQHIDRQSISLELAEDSGPICQDFIYDSAVPLISERLKAFYDDLGIDYLFYKRVLLTKSSSGIEEPYWLALPPRINCINMEMTEIDDVLYSADTIVINAARVGRYDIFKLAGVTNLEIIVTEKLAMALREKKFIGLHVYELD